MSWMSQFLYPHVGLPQYRLGPGYVRCLKSKNPNSYWRYLRTNLAIPNWGTSLLEIPWNPYCWWLNPIMYTYIYIIIYYVSIVSPLIDYIFSVFGGKIHPRWLNFPLKLSFYSGISSVSRDPRHPLWSGGAADRRQRLQPRGTGGTGSAGADGSWSMPFTNSINLKDG